ncbi:hypothetical protein AMS58_03755 [Pseudoalteromonas porphyrae]|uniref:patatin-like phospholipase family protein n=1 Tax=Pseudoalteromonas TaxID=53246 RepID=UPI0006BB3618|nr:MULTISPECIES: patatin-like phospholipase family protein [Pseudoalteromonas]KPH95805.1 hypothetical protein AMS58_03755 [Pseudoalteromonas porphyrae]
MLEIYAGSNALKTIQEQGFKPELFTSFLGASGGPKWFTLFGLDKYIFGEFFKNRTTQLNLVGSSAGAFRAACFAQKDPVAAIERLAKSYSQTRYSTAKPTPAEITEKAKQLLDDVFAQTGVAEIINNPIFKAHFIVAKSNGFVGSDHKALQLLGLTKSYLYNRVDRRFLTKQYERFIYQAPNSDFSIEDSYKIKTTQLDLTSENLKDALLASGSIPLVMQGIKNIAGSPPGMYRDGGIIDYHFDLKINNPGLILYPHFNSDPKAGWFDKNLKRKVATENYDNVVMITPSKKFIASLPYGKIPDRTDFTKLDTDTRIKYWNTVFSETERLADAFDKNLTIGKFEVKTI